jgi:hypothetical protein
MQSLDANLSVPDSDNVLTGAGGYLCQANSDSPFSRDSSPLWGSEDPYFLVGF